MKPFFLWGIMLCLLSNVFAQRLADDFTVEVYNYDIHKVGYPSKIVTDGNANPVYVEYWEPGVGRRYSGYYLQCLNDDFAELWFTPISQTPEKPYQFDQVIELDKSLAVVGYEYQAKEKKWEGRVTCFSKEGKPLIPSLKIDPPGLKKYKAGAADLYAVSPARNRLLRVHHYPKDGAKSEVFATCLTSDGKIEWSSELKIPFTEENYAIKQIAMDGEGVVWILLEYENLTGKFETDKDFLPRVVAYRYKDNSWLTWKVNLNGQSVSTAQLGMNRDGKICVTMITGNNLGGGFTNGTRNAKLITNWSGAYLQQLSAGKEITLLKDHHFSFADSTIAKFKTEGADFVGPGKIVFESGQLLWCIENQYTLQKEQGKVDFCAEVLALQADLSLGQWKQMYRIDKKQRDHAGTTLLSFSPIVTPGKVHLIYLSSVGADGKIISASIDLPTQKLSYKDVVSNEDGQFYFLADRTGRLGNTSYLFLGTGNTNKQEYRLLKIAF